MSEESEDQGASPWDELEATYKDIPTLDCVRAMAEKKAEKEHLEGLLKAIQKEFDFLRLKLIPTRFEDEGIENLKVEGVGRVSLTGDMYVRTLNKDELHEWMRDRNRGSLIQEAVQPSTLKAAVKAWIKNGEEMPNCLKIDPFTRASITRTK